MAAIAGIPANDTAAAAGSTLKNAASDSSQNQGTTEFTMQNLVDLFTKLNPSAKEFFPSHPSCKTHHPNPPFPRNPAFPPSKESFGIDFFPNYRKAMVFLSSIDFGR